MKKLTFLLLLLIVIIATALRFWQLGNVPPSPDWDEAALGYNAYSIMQTGKDEYGKFLPVVLRSFDDYKPALYAYFIIPLIKIFGLSTFSVRAPSAFFGVLTVIAVFFLVKELFKRKDLALLSSFLLAISPWHLQFSRIGFESNVGMSFNVFSALFFIKGLKKPTFLVISAILMGLNLYIYQSEKVFIPFLVLFLLFLFRKQILSLPKKYLMTSIILFGIVLVPLISFTLTNKEAFARAKGVSIFSDTTPLLLENANRLLTDNKNKDLIGLVLDNRRIFFAKSVISGYFSHFDLGWLFITGDLARHHAPSMGLLYLWELPFLIFGIYWPLTEPVSKYSKVSKLFIFSWLLIAPIPASVTSGVPHSVRTLNFLPVLQILVAIGVLGFYELILKNKNRYIKKILPIIVILIFAFNFFYYLNQYFVQQNYFNSEEWQYGYMQTVDYLKSVEGKYDKVIVSNKPYLDQSYMFFLFYLKYSPASYQSQVNNVSGGFRENHYFGKFEFRPIDWGSEQKSSKILYVGMPSDFPKSMRTVKTINFLDNQPAIAIVEG